MHLIDSENGVLGTVPIVGGTIGLAVGSALASQIRDDGRVTVSFFGDGATGEGVLYEAMNFASIRKLPILFVCENNYYSTHMPILECRSKNNISESGVPFGVTNYRVDGNDVLKVYEVAKEAVNLCRTGDGPVFLECETYRLFGHVGPDDNIQGTHTDIRAKDEIELWKTKDPLINFETFLVQMKHVDEAQITKIKQMVDDEIRDALIFANDSPRAAARELYDHVFKSTNTDI